MIAGIAVNNMKIIKFSLGQLQANCYFLIQDDACLIIDPADEAPFILEELQRRKLKLVGIAATHGHFDHVMAAGEVQKALSVKFYLSQKDLFLLDRLEETANFFLGYNPIIIRPTTINQLIGVKCRIGAFEFEKLNTPGHTPGSQCFYFKNEKIIFTGDTLFNRGIGRYDFSYSSKNDLKKSLKSLLKFSAETAVYPGHGGKTLINNEKDILNLYPL